MLNWRNNKIINVKILTPINITVLTICNYERLKAVSYFHMFIKHIHFLNSKIFIFVNYMIKNYNF